MIPQFIELNCVEFGSDDVETTPMTICVNEILSFQPVTPRIRKQLMTQQLELNVKREAEGKPLEPIKEVSANSASLMLKRLSPGQPYFSLNMFVEESYEEIKFKLKQLEIYKTVVEE